MINSTGSVVERYTYDHFGKRTILAANGSTVRASSSYNMTYGYTSRRHEGESDLMYFRARYYDPTTGEFLSRDPLEYVDGMSQYRGYFVPSSVDPNGLKVYIYGWEGAGAGVKLAYKPINDIYKVIAESVLGDEVEMTVGLQQNLNYIAQLAAANKIAKQAKTPEKEGPCGKCYPRIVLIGYSWGANTATKVAALMDLKHPDVKIDAVFTIDPVFLKGVRTDTSDTLTQLKFFPPLGNPLKPDLVTPDNFCSWKNYYQDVSTVPPFLGDQFSWATNEHIDKATLIAGPYMNAPKGLGAGANAAKQGHVYIPYIQKIQQDWSDLLSKYKGNSLRDDYGECAGCSMKED